MTSLPGGYDHFFINSALVDVALLQESYAELLDLAFSLLLNDPTVGNPFVQNLSGVQIDAIYAFTLSGLTVVYQFVNPLVIRIIHVSSLLDSID